MHYKKLINEIAAKHGVTPKEVDTEIRRAIKLSGYDMKPEVFISMLIQKVKQELY